MRRSARIVHTYKSYSSEYLIEKFGLKKKQVNLRNKLRFAMIDNKGTVKFLTCCSCSEGEFIDTVYFHKSNTASTKKYSKCRRCAQKDSILKHETRTVRLKTKETRMIPISVFIKPIGEIFSICYTKLNFESIVYESKYFVNQFKTYQLARQMLTDNVFEEIKMIEGLK